MHFFLRGAKYIYVETSPQNKSNKNLPRQKKPQRRGGLKKKKINKK